MCCEGAGYCSCKSSLGIKVDVLYSSPEASGGSVSIECVVLKRYLEFLLGSEAAVSALAAGCCYKRRRMCTDSSTSTLAAQDRLTFFGRSHFGRTHLV